jgi:chemotaxis protein MotB
MAASERPIIIKKARKKRAAHHGGAWKIAYADFVTAMMAFFLLLWLISMTTPEQKKGLADYFAPPNVALSTSGAGGVLGGNAIDSSGAKMAGSKLDPAIDPSIPAQGTAFGAGEIGAGGRQGDLNGEASAKGAAQANLQSQNDQAFHSAAASIRQAWQSLPDITEISDNLILEQTEDGLNIQLINDAGRPMFAEGSKFPTELARQAVIAIAPILQKLSNRITISGHTAAGGSYANPRYGSWDLSSDRANVVRALLGEFGLADDRIASVIGRSSTDPFFPNDPYQAANERVQITVLNEAPPVPLNLGL